LDKLVKKMLIMLVVMVAATSTVLADEIPLTFSTESGLRIQLGGEIELEFIDVEKPGGFSNQDLVISNLRVDNRSPHMRIDKAVLSTKIFYNENIYYKIELNVRDDRASVDKHYARIKLPDYNTRLEVGKNKPMVARSRRTEGYALIGTAFWKGREYHVTSKTAFDLSETVGVDLGLSFAMKRPLAQDDVAEDKSFPMYTYDDYDVKDGQTFEYGVMLGTRVSDFYAQGWYYIGKLIDDYEWKQQLTMSLSDYDSDDMTHWWAGGRVGFDNKTLHACAEYITAKDGLLPRNGYYVEGGVVLGRFQPIARYGVLNVEDYKAYTGNPRSWDRELITFAVLTKLHEFITLKTEYYIVNEETGGTGGTSPSSVDDNQFLMQLKFEF